MALDRHQLAFQCECALGRAGAASAGDEAVSGIRIARVTAEEECMSARYGMVIDLDRCTGCGSCMMACAAENNVPALPQATARTGLTPLLVRKVSDGNHDESRREAFIPIMCMHCEHDTPCVKVCPQQAVEVDEATGNAKESEPWSGRAHARSGREVQPLPCTAAFGQRKSRGRRKARNRSRRL